MQAQACIRPYSERAGLKDHAVLCTGNEALRFVHHSLILHSHGDALDDGATAEDSCYGMPTYAAASGQCWLFCKILQVSLL